MSYEQLDKIADSYTPILFALTMIYSVIESRRQRLRITLITSLILLVNIFVVYLFMFIDRELLIFPRVGLDYSTHTGISLVLCATLLVLIRAPVKRWGLVVSFVMYILLMLYQRYHSLADILLTIAVLFPCMLLAYSSYRLRTNTQH